MPKHPAEIAAERQYNLKRSIEQESQMAHEAEAKHRRELEKAEIEYKREIEREERKMKQKLHDQAEALKSEAHKETQKRKSSIFDTALSGVKGIVGSLRNSKFISKALKDKHPNASAFAEGIGFGRKKRRKRAMKGGGVKICYNGKMVNA